jgi:predicted  nucleic acid-binding Zn-ribbon protein
MRETDSLIAFEVGITGWFICVSLAGRIRNEAQAPSIGEEKGNICGNCEILVHGKNGLCVYNRQSSVHAP